MIIDVLKYSEQFQSWQETFQKKVEETKMAMGTNFVGHPKSTFKGNPKPHILDEFMRNRDRPVTIH